MRRSTIVCLSFSLLACGGKHDSDSQTEDQLAVAITSPAETQYFCGPTTFYVRLAVNGAYDSVHLILDGAVIAEVVPSLSYPLTLDGHQPFPSDTHELAAEARRGTEHVLSETVHLRIDCTGPTLASASPPEGGIGGNPDLYTPLQLSLTFDEPLDPASVASVTMGSYPTDGAFFEPPIQATLDDSGTVLTVWPVHTAIPEGDLSVFIGGVRDRALNLSQQAFVDYTVVIPFPP